MQKMSSTEHRVAEIDGLMRDPQDLMNIAEADAWCWFNLIVRKFRESHKEDNYSEIVENTFSSFRQLSCNISIKMYYLPSHFDCSLGNFGEFRDEQGDWFRQDLRTTGENCPGYTEIVIWWRITSGSFNVIVLK